MERKTQMDRKTLSVRKEGIEIHRTYLKGWKEEAGTVEG